MQLYFLYSNKNLLKIVFLFLVAFLIPKFLPLYAPVNIEKDTDLFKFGIENVSDDLIEYLKFGKNGFGFNIALLNDKMSVNQHNKSFFSYLLKSGIYLKAVFSKKTKFPVVHRAVNHYPLKDTFNSSNILNSIDLFLLDFQGSGVSDYFVEYLYNIMSFSLENNKKIIIFDRPNPLGCIIEGPFNKFGVPLRHSLTIGELAKFLNFENFSNKVDLTVIPMSSYFRSAKLLDLVDYKEKKLKKAKSYFYKSICKVLSNIEPFFVGKGSSKPYNCLMLPKKVSLNQEKWEELKSLLNVRFGIDSFYCSYFDKVDNVYYTGLFLEIENNNFSVVNTVMFIINFLKKEGIELKAKENLDAYFKEMLKSDFDKDLLNNENKLNLSNFSKVSEHVMLYKPYSVPAFLN